MRENLGFRSWFYFRMGWATYFAFLFAAVNTLTVTYFLAIENYPILKEIFPSFIQYIIIIIVIGVPLLTLVGYVHYKRSAAYKSEADIFIESNPHMLRMLKNTEAILPFYIQITNLIIKLSKNEKITEQELEKISKLNQELSEHMKDKTIRE